MSSRRTSACSGHCSGHGLSSHIHTRTFLDTSPFILPGTSIFWWDTWNLQCKRCRDTNHSIPEGGVRHFTPAGAICFSVIPEEPLLLLQGKAKPARELLHYSQVWAWCKKAKTICQSQMRNFGICRPGNEALTNQNVCNPSPLRLGLLTRIPREMIALDQRL